jgi:hypothetical protein
MMTNKPTVKELSDFYTKDYLGEPLFEEIEETADPSWRHGCYMSTVYKRLEDNTFWNVKWKRSSDDEINTLRDEEIPESNISQVYPQKVTKTIYLTKKP